MTSHYADTYDAWRRDPEGFWAAAAEPLHWQRRWDRVLDDSAAARARPLYRWFTGATTNTCY
ncbi:MAG TPA: acetyl-coenzyme A synthetase N-terminal domain-containing protein, partial [Thermoanaerobaculia bacterium]|nr:acetyl-coenzyme A synthetase N-terminal domain-containing protein [Thermoanaerobaculia bacterium]